MGVFQDFIDSFKPAKTQYVKEVSMDKIDGANDEESKESGEEEGLKRHLKGRHLQMIAIGGSIGTGLFVGSGESFVYGGPASVLIAFVLIGMMLFPVVHALGELAVLYPVQGSFALYGTRFLDPAWGFAMGWNYALQWLIVLPLELSAAGMVIAYWKTGVNNGVWITIFLILIVCINLLGVKGYGEAEFVFSIIKVIAVLGFIICAICIDVGASPKGVYYGTSTYHNPGAFVNGFPGLCACFVNAAFSFSGTELVGLAAAETANPRITLPKATKQVFWRILFFYVLSLLLIGFIVPYNDPNLLNGTRDASSSPFVIAINYGDIKVLPDMFNVVILIAVLSVGNSSTYGSSRTLAALAKQGQAPRIFEYIDRRGRPITALGLSLFMGLLAYINIATAGPVVFDWLLAISGLSSFFTWGSICLCHIRFRAGWKAQGHSLDELPFRSAVGVLGSWYGLIFNILCLIAQFYVAVWPVGGDGVGTAYGFFMAYAAAPTIIIFYIAYKIYHRSKFVGNHEMDLNTGRRLLDAKQAAEDDFEENSKPMWKKLVENCW